MRAERRYLSTTYEVPHNANMLGFVVLDTTEDFYRGLRSRARKAGRQSILNEGEDLTKIPFQYIEKIPVWTKAANYTEVGEITGRFEGFNIYNNSSNQDITLNLIYYADATEDIKRIYRLEDLAASDPYPTNFITEERVTEKIWRGLDDNLTYELNQEDIARANNPSGIVKESVTQTNLILNQPSPDKIPVRLRRTKIDSYWTIERIERLVKRLKSFEYPQYDKRYSPPQKLLLNIGKIYKRVPIILKSISVDEDGPFLEDGFLSIGKKINLELRTAYPLWQAIGQQDIYVSSDGNGIFAHKRVKTHLLGTL